MNVTSFARPDAGGRAADRDLDARVAALARQLQTLHQQGALDIPLVGGGKTAAPNAWPCTVELLGRADLSLARVAEAHTDAIAILAEAGRVPLDGALYGVWASRRSRQPAAARSHIE